jgi:hypothetical protein
MTVDRLLAAIAETRRAVAADAAADLAGLDTMTGELCTAAATLHPSQRNVAATELARVVAALDELAADLAAQQERARRAEAERAAVAYGKPAAR